jgi:hypothetical protein
VNLPDLGSAVTLWGSSTNTDPTSLKAGRDLVLQARRRDAEQLAPGVLLDDWLSPAQREGIDGEARRRAAEWESTRGPALRPDDVPLAHIHELELYTDVFLPETRVVQGLRTVLERTAPSRLTLRGLDSDLGACLTDTLFGVEIVAEGEPGVAPTYPLTFQRELAPARRLSGAIRKGFGFPGRARGRVVIESYWHLVPVWQALAARPDAAPVMNLVPLPGLPTREVLTLAAKGGWVGAPGAGARRRSRRLLRRALAELHPESQSNPLDHLLDRRALTLLGAQALDTVAEAGVRRKAFAHGRVRAAVGYSDTAPGPRLNAMAAREQGAAVVQVQHGMFGHLPRDNGRPARIVDGWIADLLALWSEHDAASFAPYVPGEVHVTGNPGAERLLGTYAARHAGGKVRRVLLLGQMTTPLSTGTDVRVTAKHMRAALDGLSAAASGCEVSVRPHPLDLERDLYLRIAGDYPGVTVRLEAGGPVEQAIGAADLCVGALSTATLQSALLGTPAILLDVTGMELSWPFDGSGAFPTARCAEELASLVGSLRSGPETPGREAALEALGARPGATERVADVVELALARG